MPSRKSPAQIRAEIRRAVGKYNSGVREVNRSIDRYNREARAHNSRVRANRARLQQDIRRLQSSQQSSIARMRYRTSVTAFTETFTRLEQRSSGASWAGTDLLEFSETETANSIAALNALLEESSAIASDADVEELQTTGIGHELARLNADLDARWRGALFALHPRNPDAARHFCTSAREMLSDMLENVAPTLAVEANDPSCDRTPHGSVSRRARIRFCLRRQGTHTPELEDFVEGDIENVLALFHEFNTGTHGAAGRFTLGQLRALKDRVEHAIRFIVRIAS